MNVECRIRLRNHLLELIKIEIGIENDRGPKGG